MRWEVLVHSPCVLPTCCVSFEQGAEDQTGNYQNKKAKFEYSDICEVSVCTGVDDHLNYSAIFYVSLLLIVLL